MAECIEFKKKRLDSSCLDKILDAQTSDVLFEKTISNEDIVIKGVTIKSLTIKDSNFKSSLSFIGCKFLDIISITETKCTGTISFTDCVVRGDLIIYRLFVDTALQFFKNKVKGNIFIDGTITKHIEVDSSSANKITITSSKSSCSINKITFDSCYLDKSITVSNINDLITLNVIKLSTPDFHLKHLNTSINASLSLIDSKIYDMTFERSSLASSSNFFINRCTFKNLGIINNKFEDSKLSILDSLITGILSILGIVERKSFFDISTSTPSNINLDNSLTEFIKNRKVKTPLLSNKKNLRQKIGTLKILKTNFANDHHYEMEDKCFYILKNSESKIKIKDRKHIKKTFPYLSYLISRYVFGWGVKIANPIISALLFLMCFSIYYYITLNLNQYSNSVEYLDQKITGIYASFIVSVLSFFGQHADLSFNSPIQTHTFLIEFIFGIVMTTVIVGILIRKLVR